MIDEFAGICSNPKCDYKDTYVLALGPEIFCTRCGELMITKCSKCGKEFSKDVENYCPDCGTKIKQTSE